MKFRKVRLTHIAIAIFLIVVLTLLAIESKAETIAEAAPATFIAGHHYDGAGISMTERFGGRYDLGITLMSALQCACSRGDAPGNLGVHAQRIVAWRALELGLGVAYWQNQTPAWSSNTTFALHWGFRLGHWRIVHRHYSTGGASDRNGGLDLLTVGYNFQ